MTPSEAADAPLVQRPLLQEPGQSETVAEVPVGREGVAAPARHGIDLLLADHLQNNVHRGIATAVLFSVPFWALLALGLYLIL